MKYEVWFENVQDGFFDFQKIPAVFVRVLDNPAILSVPKQAPIIWWLAEDFDVSPDKVSIDFSGNFFGAGNMLKIVQKDLDGFLIEAEIPKMVSILEQNCPECNGAGFVWKKFCLNCNGTGVIKTPCNRCNGTGEESDYDGECLICKGNGYETKIDWTSANGLMANLQFLFRLLNVFLTDKSQIEYFPMISKNPYSVNIGGRIENLSTWLLGLTGKNYYEVREIMEAVYCFMWGDKERYGFEVEIRPNESAFHLQCPGDRCCVYANQSFDFNSHNIDNPAQALALFAGVSQMERLRNQ